MGQEGQVVELFDFLYRDSARIASYYAQLFGGHLATFEDATSDRSGQERSGKLTFLIASGDLKSTAETQKSSKRLLNPHDLIATDVLAGLREGRKLHEDARAAPHGALIQAHGTLVFVDRGAFDLGLASIKAAAAAERKKPRNKQSQEVIQGSEVMEKVVEKMPMPSSFLLQLPDGLKVAGTIKESGLEEPISTYYFKRGMAGLSEVYLVGIKEIAGAPLTIPTTDFFGASQHMAEGMQRMMFPRDAVRVTPVALFRRLRNCESVT